MMNSILKISNLNLSFVSKKNEEDSLYLFRDLSLEVPREKITALVGGNGAGKTTLFNVISGLRKDITGKISFEDRNLIGLKPYQIAQLGIGRLFQGAKVYEELSILENMLLGDLQPQNEFPFFTIVFWQKYNKIEKEQINKVEFLLSDLFGNNNYFLDHRHQPAGRLSYGQQRLLAMARLLMGNYSFFLLDEPTAGVHAKYIEHISKLIGHMNLYSHKTVLLIEHNMQFVRQIAENCLFIDNGNIIAKGLPNDVLDSEIVQHSYMGF